MCLKKTPKLVVRLTPVSAWGKRYVHLQLFDLRRLQDALAALAAGAGVAPADIIAEIGPKRLVEAVAATCHRGGAIGVQKAEADAKRTHIIVVAVTKYLEGFDNVAQHSIARRGSERAAKGTGHGRGQRDDEGGELHCAVRRLSPDILATVASNTG